MLGRVGATDLAAACTQSPRAPAPAIVAPHAGIGAWGLDLSARDPAVRPGDDFYRALGHRLDTNHIPAHRQRRGSFDELAERAHEQVRTLLAGLPPAAPAGRPAQKVGDHERVRLW